MLLMLKRIFFMFMFLGLGFFVYSILFLAEFPKIVFSIFSFLKTSKID